MTRYLISFDAHAMDHIPDEDMPAVAKAAHEVVQEALNAGVWVFGGGLENQKATVVSTDGTSPRARTRRPSVGSASSTCPHARRRWSGPPRPPSPAAARKKSGSSCPTRPSETDRHVDVFVWASVLSQGSQG
jgi:hypothetical protein